MLSAQNQDWQLCKSNQLFPALIHSQDGVNTGDIYASADKIESQSNQVSTLRGNVLIEADTQLLQADEAVYSVDQQRFDLFGNVRYQSEEFQSISQSMSTLINTGDSKMYDAYFFITTDHTNGHAEKIIRYGDVTTLHNTHYSSCDPDDQDWQFRAKKIKLDHAKGRGLAKSMTLRFKKNPRVLFTRPQLSTR